MGYGAPIPSADRAAWVTDVRRRNERLQDAFLETHDFDAEMGEIGDTHRRFVGRFLAALPPHGRVLDAPCGTGKYFAMVLESGRSLLGVDHSAGMLAEARAKFPQVQTEKFDLQDLRYRDEFDGVMCIDAMESLPPEDWPRRVRSIPPCPSRCGPAVFHGGALREGSGAVGGRECSKVGLTGRGR